MTGGRNHSLADRTTGAASSIKLLRRNAMGAAASDVDLGGFWFPALHCWIILPTCLRREFG
jgi:hypothetical protein